MNGWQTFYRTLIVIGTLVAAYILWEVREIVLVLFAAVIFASTIRPYVEYLTRFQVPPIVAVLTIYTAVLAGLGGLLIIAVPPLARFTVDIMSEDLLMQQLRDLMGTLLVFLWEEFQVYLPLLEVPDQLREMLSETDAGGGGQVLPVAMATAGGLGRFLLAMVMSYYWLTHHANMLDLLIHLNPPRSRDRIRDIWTDIETTLGSYVRSQFLLMIVVGVACFAGLLLLRVPYALALAVVAGLMELIPIIGPIIGVIPAALVGFSESTTTGLLILAWYFVVNQIEAHVLIPKLMESSLGLNPLVVILAIVAGGTLNGVVGAVLAIPVAGALQVIVQHLVIAPALEKRQPRTEEGGVLLEEEAESIATP